jgi:hypothetical protein
MNDMTKRIIAGIRRQFPRTCGDCFAALAIALQSDDLPEKLTREDREALAFEFTVAASEDRQK